jgi:hypothetical protein
MSMTMTLGEQTLEFLNQFDDFKRSIKHMADLDDYEYTKWMRQWVAFRVLGKHA